MSRRSESDPDIHDSAIQADEALAEAVKLPYGAERTAALKKAGELRMAVDKRGIRFAKRGRPPKAT